MMFRMRAVTCNLITEYPVVNGISAETGAGVTYGEDDWNATYRNPEVTFAWMNYSISNDIIPDNQ